MVYLTSWEEFSKAVEGLYSADPMKVINVKNFIIIKKITFFFPKIILKCRMVMKYRNKTGLCLKITDNRSVREYINK